MLKNRTVFIDGAEVPLDMSNAEQRKAAVAMARSGNWKGLGTAVGAVLDAAAAAASLPGVAPDLGASAARVLHAADGVESALDAAKKSASAVAGAAAGPEASEQPKASEPQQAKAAEGAPSSSSRPNATEARRQYLALLAVKKPPPAENGAKAAADAPGTQSAAEPKMKSGELKRAVVDEAQKKSRH